VAHRRSSRFLLAAGVLGAAGALAGLGTWATFTDTAPVSQGAISAGTVDIAIPGPGTSNRLTLGASGIVPGDTLQRAVDLTNAGSEDLASITLTTSASPSSVLDTDATNGLQLAIDRCSVPWTESGTSPAFTYTCSGTTSTVLATRPVIGSNLALSNLSALTAGATDHLRVKLSFPSSAGNTFQGVSSAITYTFTATQRAGTAK
jgi:spore coat-associated protein N